jgi:hypothetical protein
VPAGSALRVTGDGATLGCAGSSGNGRVTVGVGAQTLALREPYGAGEVAILGPWVTAGNVPYSIALKDGPCENVVSGVVSVP